MIIKNILTLAVLATSLNTALAKTKIYPFVAMEVDEIYSDVEKVTEDKNYIKNFYDIIDQGLNKKTTDRQPWTTSYWPLAKGVIADPFENASVPYYLDFARTYIYQWKATKKSFDKRKKTVLKYIDQLSNEELTQLAPSEKYDLLLGDTSFDLTNRLMDYMYRYGKNNYYSELVDITAAAANTAELATKYVEWGWYDSIETALKVDTVLNRRIESQRALALLKSGQETDPLKAIEIVLPQALEEDKNYIIDEPLVQNIASWEGICNGWSTAAGLIPRPRKAISFELGKRSNGTPIKLKFYPDDIKGLVSLYWFNSLIQGPLTTDQNGEYQSGGTILVGNRCSAKAREDVYGRLYDTKVNKYTGKLTPSCSGVHPAKWHLALANLIGKQGRSFIVERKVDSPVDNHPMYGYSFKYFNPYSGTFHESVERNIVEVHKRDQFKNNRHPKTKYIVGVETTMNYLEYLKPVREDYNSESDDEITNKTMIYDLELDEDYNIIGGQWRSTHVGKPRNENRVGPRDGNRKEDRNHNQPDFFWVVTKDWKKSGLFDNQAGLEEWTDKTQAPPKSWLAEAHKYHAFEYLESTKYGNAKECKVKNKITGEKRTVWCELARNRPQPLANIVNILVELSSGVKFKNF